MDRTEVGRQMKLLVVVDEYTREYLAIEAGRTYMTEDVSRVLNCLFAVRGTLQHIRSDNGPELVTKAVRSWLERAAFKTLFISTASP